MRLNRSRITCLTKYFIQNSVVSGYVCPWAVDAPRDKMCIILLWHVSISKCDFRLYCIVCTCRTWKYTELCVFFSTNVCAHTFKLIKHSTTIHTHSHKQNVGRAVSLSGVRRNGFYSPSNYASRARTYAIACGSCVERAGFWIGDCVSVYVVDTNIRRVVRCAYKHTHTHTYTVSPQHVTSTRATSWSLSYSLCVRSARTRRTLYRQIKSLAPCAGSVCLVRTRMWHRISNAACDVHSNTPLLYPFPYDGV